MLISWPATKMWVSSIMSWVYTDVLNTSETGLVFRLLRKFAVALFTFIFVVGGSILGLISGAIKGPASEVGLFGGMSVGAFSGAITGVQLIELIVDGEPFSKVAVICSLLNGKFFIELVNMEASLRDILDVSSVRRGLSEDEINELPSLEFSDRSKNETLRVYHHHTNCAICIEDFTDAERARLLPNCRHFFHLKCIDEWLKLQGTCPICRQDVSWQVGQEK